MVDLNKVKRSDLWYVIGYIATDGSLSIDGRHIIITSKDRAHLYSLRKALLLKNRIGRKARGYEIEKKYSQLQFGDINFYRYLISLGLTPNKSLTLGSLKIDNNFFIDFLRGVIDGDGNIATWVHKTNNHTQWCLRIYSASNSFIKWLNKEIGNEFGLESKVYLKKAIGRKNYIYHLRFGKIAASKIFKEIYYIGSLSLERKFLRARLCLQHRSKSVKL